MKPETESLMEGYASSPTIILSDDLLDVDYTKEVRNILKNLEINTKRLNPIEVVIESLLNLKIEKISSQKLTQSPNKVFINKEIFETAVKELTEDIGNDLKGLEEIHRKWCDKLKMFVDGIRQGKEIKLAKVIYLVSKKFRISSLSAIKAIVPIFRQS